MRSALRVLTTLWLVVLGSSPTFAKEKSYYWYAVIGCEVVVKETACGVHVNRYVNRTSWTAVTTNVRWFPILEVQKANEKDRGGSCIVLNWAEIDQDQYAELNTIGR